jgi:hypothetical protein
MLTRTFIPLLIVALTGALALACGSPDRIFIDLDVGTPPPPDSSMNVDASSDGTSTPDQQGQDDAVGLDTRGVDASTTDLRPDTTPDVRDVTVEEAAPTDDTANADSVTVDVLPDVAPDVGVAADADADADATMDGGAPDIWPDILDCTGTPTPRISPTGTVGICPGKTATLTSSTATSYLWSNGATTASIDVGSAGSYTVTTTDARGCTATSAPTTVTAYPDPPTPNISAAGSTRFCSGGSVTLTASSATSYLWSTAATTQSIVATASGSYSVTTTDANGCSATSPPLTVTAVVPTTGSSTYAYSGTIAAFTVPECITEVQVDARGAQGGSNNSVGTLAPGGYGGRIVARLTVIPSAVLQVRVGGQGLLCSASNAGGYNGGGPANCTGYSEMMSIFYSGTGGGATDVRLGPYTLDDRVIVAGGGGGAGYNCRDLSDSGGSGGGAIGGKYVPACGNADATGGGGTQASGGAGGIMSSYGNAGAGLFGLGGSGVCTGGTITASEGGGGGGGYWGGGGGAWHGGGGGSDYFRTTIARLVSQSQGYNPGHGSLTITWPPP